MYSKSYKPPKTLFLVILECHNLRPVLIFFFKVDQWAEMTMEFNAMIQCSSGEGPSSNIRWKMEALPANDKFQG